MASDDHLRWREKDKSANSSLGGGKLEKKIRGRGGRTDKVGKRANKEISSFFLYEFKYTKQWLIGFQFSHSVLSSPPTFPDPGPSPLILFCFALFSSRKTV